MCHSFEYRKAFLSFYTTLLICLLMSLTSFKNKCVARLLFFTKTFDENICMKHLWCISFFFILFLYNLDEFPFLLRILFIIVVMTILVAGNDVSILYSDCLLHALKIKNIWGKIYIHILSICIFPPKNTFIGLTKGLICNSSWRNSNPTNQWDLWGLWCNWEQLWGYNSIINNK